jgi:ribosomal protein L30/L7E
METIDIKERIEMMNKHHQIEVLRILKQNSDVVLNENSNGVFVNLSDLHINLIKKIEDYIRYVEKQTNNINVIENKKEVIENTFFKCKGNKDNVIIKITQ